MKDKGTSKIRIAIAITFNIIAGLIILVFTVMSFIRPFNFSGQTNNVKLDAQSGWYYIDSLGTLTSRSVDLEKLEFDEKTGDVSLIRTISSDELQGADLCFVSTNISFDVYINEKKLYSFQPEMKSYMGTSYSNAVHAITIPGFSENADIRIDAHRMGEGMFSGFRRAFFQSGDLYHKDLNSDNFYKLVISFVVFFIGLGQALSALFLEFRPLHKLESISIGVMAMLLAVWTNSGTYMLEVYANDPGMIRMVSFLALILLPLPGLTLVLCASRRSKSKGFILIEVLVSINLILHIILINSGEVDYHELLPITHGIFILTIIIAIINVILAFAKKKIVEHSQIVVLAFFGLLMMSGVVDLIFFYVGNGGDSARFSRIGLLIFTLFISGYEVWQFIQINKKSYEAELMKRLAHEDGLTGLENRLAFTEYERGLAMRSEGLVYIVQFDINFLKKVNDSYGHSVGDKYIKAAADVIEKSFGEYGRVFRIGGDEFVAIMENDSTLMLGKTYRDCERKMKELIDEYNEREKQPVPLVLAYGMAEYNCSEGNPEEKERLADERMYKHKARLKQESSST